MKIKLTKTIAHLGVTQEVSRIILVKPFGVPSGITEDAFAAKGDLLVGTGPATFLTLPVESDGLVLTAAAAEAGGMSWEPSPTTGNATLTNKAGVDRAAYDVVVKDASNDSAFKTTTSLGGLGVIGVLVEDVANNAVGQVAVSPRVITINVQGNVTRGDYLYTSTTAGRAASAGAVFIPGCFAIALTAYAGGGAGQVTALLILGLGLSFLDSEGDPADVGTTGDGTSKYGARRDHVHAIAAASDTVSGKVELATTAETTSGADATRAVTPDGLAGSAYGKRVVQIEVFDAATSVTTGDGKKYFVVPTELNGYNLVDADAAVITYSSSGTPTIQIRNVTDSHDMLSTRITIDINEYTSYVPDAPPVINGSYDDVATGDILAIDVDVAGTGTKGLLVILSFQLP